MSLKENSPLSVREKFGFEVKFIYFDVKLTINVSSYRSSRINIEKCSYQQSLSGRKSFSLRASEAEQKRNEKLRVGNFSL